MTKGIPNPNEDLVYKPHLADVSEINAYNDVLGVIRVKYNSFYYDFRYLSMPVVPNSDSHFAIIHAPTKSLTPTRAIYGDRLSLLPGVDKDNKPISLPFGHVVVMPKTQNLAATNHSCGASAFSIHKSDMDSLKRNSIALSPPLKGDYTNTDSRDDLADTSAGIFINEDGSILIKSISSNNDDGIGSSITMGPNGMYLAGEINWEHAEHHTGTMQGNTFHKLIPSTIPTAVLSYPVAPDSAMIGQLASAGGKVISFCKIAKAASQLG